jgi:hypothetical protein
MTGKGMTFEEKLASGYYIRDAKPKPVAVATIPLAQADAEVVAANPESVRVTARRPDGVTVIAKPQSNPNCVTVRTDLVREIDAEGRPVWDDELSGAISEYHPWSGLRR